MRSLSEVLKKHPTFDQNKLEKVERCIKQTLTCASVCRICADACLSERDISNFQDCIKTNLICANMCEATANTLSYSVSTHGAMTQVVKACMEVTSFCAQECEKHSEKMEHCRVCMETCRQTYETCKALLD